MWILSLLYSPCHWLNGLCLDFIRNPYTSTCRGVICHLLLGIRKQDLDESLVYCLYKGAVPMISPHSHRLVHSAWLRPGSTISKQHSGTTAQVSGLWTPFPPDPKNPGLLTPDTSTHQPLYRFTLEFLAFIYVVLRCLQSQMLLGHMV